VPPGSSCGAVYDRLNTTPGCPFPETLTRDAYVMFCEQVRSRSAMCASQMDAYNVCALEASVECVEAGGMFLPNPVGCPVVDSSCFDTP
jgi:hypothetical protein